MSNVILIMMDQLMAYHNLPEKILDLLPGYNAFRKIGLEFTKMQNNRQACSSSRSVIMSSQINTGIQDNIDQSFQYDTVPQLDPDVFRPVAHLYKDNGYDYTAYYGKSHLDAKLATTDFITPKFCTNTRQAMVQYGYDIYSTFGDSYYRDGRAHTADLFDFLTMLPPTATEYDFIAPVVGQKFSGISAFLKARLADGKTFYVQYMMSNPHDTQEFWQNFAQTPAKSQEQYFAPFLDEQTTDKGITNPYIYNSDFTDAYKKDANLTTNYFEKTYHKYKTEKSSLPFLKSYEDDYVSNPKYNGIFPYFVANQETFVTNFTFPDSPSDLASWKNLINNYYGLIIQADSYIYEIYKFLEDNNLLSTTSVIITADHGDCMSSHGLKQKAFHFNNSTNIPFVIASPKLDGLLKGKKTDVLCSSIDIFPTIKVISNLDGKDNYLGSSLLRWKNDLLVVTKKDHEVLHFVNGLMFSATYFNFHSWYRSQSSKIQAKVLNPPKSFYEYQSPFIFIMTKLEEANSTCDSSTTDKLYKFVRFFSIYELLKFNFETNKNLPQTFKKCDILKLITETESQTHLSKLVDKLPCKFSFKKGLSHLNKDNDNIELYIYFSFIARVLQRDYPQNLYYLPGYGTDDVNDILDNKQMSIFCYNMTDDPAETINLADRSHPDRIKKNIKILQVLNRKLNTLMKNSNMKRVYYIIPDTLKLGLVLCLKKFGLSFHKYTSNQLFTITSYIGKNNFDTPFTSKEHLLIQDTLLHSKT